MIENILYTLTETSLLAGIAFLFLKMFISKSQESSSFKIAQMFVVFSLASAVLFYNKGILPQYFETSSFSTLAYGISCILVLVWLLLASKWFLNTKEQSSTYFCILALSALLCFSLILKAAHFGVLLASLSFLSVIQYCLFRLSKQNEDLYHAARRYGLISLIFLSLFGFSVFLLVGNLSYTQAAMYITEISPLFKMLIILGILCGIFFFLNIAPFHFWLTDTISPLVLPVATYFNIVSQIALWGLFFKLQTTFFQSLNENLQRVYFAFGVLSIILGIVGANASRFLRKIFASISLYQAGVILLFISTLKENLTSSCFIYLELYLFVLLGVYICFYAFKINGEYPVNLNLLKGVSSSKPYVSATFLFDCVTLLGLPPLTYFMMQFMLLTEIAQHPLIIYIILFGLLSLLPVYLKIIETIFFLKKEQNFDRVDFSFYIYLLIHTVLLIIFMFKPQILLLQMNILN